jgi:preprotein translocase subunit SecA
MDHLDAIDDLREGIGLRGYGQRDPLVEYKNEAFSMFERLMATIDSDIIHRIYKVQVQLAPSQQQQPMEFKPASASETPKIETKLSEAAKNARSAEASHTPVVNARKSLGRNDPCPCGSGKKWKKCHYPDIP